MSALAAGSVLQGGRYRIDGVLGQGGFGITYAATQTVLNAPVAIKELFPSGTLRQGQTVFPPATFGLQEWAQAKRDFTTEAQLLAQFQHPDIVRVLDLFEDSGTAYMVMERLAGETLQQRLERRGALDPQDVQGLAERVARALGVVHSAGLLHRDLKPDNIFLEASGRVVLIDFGSARGFVVGQTVRHTRLVTPGYAPMEQYGSEARFGPYTDIYALGATLHHALTGKMPPSAPDLMTGTPLPALPANTPAGLQDALQAALSPRVTDRPQSAQEFLTLLSGPPSAPAVPAPAPQLPTPLAPPAQKRGFSAWPLALVALAGAGGFALLRGHDRSSPPAAATPAEPPVVPEASTPPADPAIPPAPTAAPPTTAPPTTAPPTTAPPTTPPAPAPEAAPPEPAPPEAELPAPAEAEPTPDVPAISDGQVREFVDEYLRLGGQDDLNASMNLYAEQVEYFDQGTQSRAALMDDKRAYFRRWPRRSYQRTTDIALHGSGDVRQVRFDYRYTVSNDTRELSGTAYTVLDLVGDGEHLVITAERGAIHPETKVERDLAPENADELSAAAEALTNTLKPTLTEGNSGPAVSRLQTLLQAQGAEVGVDGFFGPETTDAVKGFQQSRGLEADGVVGPDTWAALEAQADTTQAATTPAEAPTFAQWFFTTCQDAQTGASHTGLTLGALQFCSLVIETVPNGARPVSASFSYELEYLEDGEARKKTIGARSRWPADGEPAVNFEEQGNNLVFSLPLTVREREGRQYTSINVIGDIVFDNGRTKRVYEKLPIQ
ncbi:hypothetical protein D3875_06560 [Deinococcus cavernae]|uniref:Protein kinase domain-containing protein n=2 Tax=Deinococcus cavernae TaxID=2320857 RepID=A0A418V594_9DEIO|nr:serine/threonine-protein kinase [Deinococcus cavernae]RJF71283.1 hypothetical protein D3875_06560 [Deinococcus cavernae]